MEREIEFFTTYQVNAPLQQCRQLLAWLKRRNRQIIPKSPMRLAWGSGWRGMTGDGLAESEMAVMREAYRLGRPGLPFPKTRRLAVQGSPCLPLGWVRLMPWNVAQVPVAPIRSPENSAGMAWVESQLAQIQQAHRCPADEALRGQALGQAWQALADPMLKAAALAAIRARWQTKGWWDQPSGKAMKKGAGHLSRGTVGHG
ncbi:MAG: hypothetical protein IPL59_15150 [Candidatus Competibacteraceae bacterium]|nr:hypothetical protein [Candidatus Competibacteraceae bacterium]